MAQGLLWKIMENFDLMGMDKEKQTRASGETQQKRNVLKTVF